MFSDYAARLYWSFLDTFGTFISFIFAKNGGLLVPHFGIDASRGVYQFLMSSSLNYDPVFEDHDHVRIDHSGQSVGYYQSGPVFADVIKCTLDISFCLSVQGRSGLVQQNYFRSLKITSKNF